MYLKQKNQTLEDELLKYVNILFTRYVPNDVRSFIEMKNGGEVQPVPEKKRTPSQRKKRDPETEKDTPEEKNTADGEKDVPDS